MTVGIDCGWTFFRLLTICELALAAMVLPRPPSSPNGISHEGLQPDSEKFRNDKALYVQLNTNVEKPNTDGYRLLEIELHGAEEVDERNLRGLVRAMLSSEDDGQPENLKNDSEKSYPHPEVVPNSILGVRDVGLSTNYRINPFSSDKRTLLRPANNVGNNKLYYLKNTKPKVDVRVRGHSGSYVGDEISKTSKDQTTINRPPESRRSAKNLGEKKARRPKKYEQATNEENEHFENANEHSPLSRRVWGTGEYEPRPDKEISESTTENMAVTSSELPKQIPAPPSHVPSRIIVAQTTPIQKRSLRRTDILPGYSYGDP